MTSSQGNVLETARLRLRPLTTSEADVEAWVKLHADPAVSEFVGSYTRERAIERLQVIERQWAERGHGLFAVESLADGRFLGRSGLQYWEQWDEVEAGWTYHPDAQGQGYATEAASAFLEWGWRRLDVASVTAMIEPRNLASARVAQRLGFTVRERAEREGRDFFIYHLPRPTAQKSL
jgi:RimJ/RimL family protein N-acetyltransferase